MMLLRNMYLWKHSILQKKQKTKQKIMFKTSNVEHENLILMHIKRKK